MSGFRVCTSRFFSESLPPSPLPTRTRADFYREEVLRYRECLREQREHFSGRALSQIDAALDRVLARLDTLSVQQNADELVSDVLKQLDVVARLSAWRDPKHLH